jgi:hypothetical protein
MLEIRDPGSQPNPNHRPIDVKNQQLMNRLSANTKRPPYKNIGLTLMPTRVNRLGKYIDIYIQDALHAAMD